MNAIAMALKPFYRIWVEAVQSYRTILNVRWLLLGVVVGLLSGVGAILFFGAIELLRHFLLGYLGGMHLPAPAGEQLFHGAGEVHRAWLLPVFLTATGLLTGWLIARYIPHTRNGGTDGTDSMIKCFHQQSGLMKPIVPLIKVGTSILTIASGGSAGREGPISLLGAGCGSWLAGKLHLSTKERRIMLLAGAAGGLGAIFRAPLGGALTAVEVIYREDFEAEAILPSVISSVVSYSLFTLAFGTDPIFGIPKFSFSDVRELPFYMILAVACAASGWFYVRTFTFVKYRVFWPMTDKLGFTWTLGLGGLAMGLLGMAFPQLLCGGYGWLELAILGKLSVAMMVGIIFGKTLATSIVLGSGMSGGMFAPALFVGGMTGGVVGFVSNSLFPSLVTQPGGYVLVGMAAFFAGVANAPIGPMIMVCELTQGYGLLAPLMLASVVCIVLGKKTSLYENQVENKFESPAHIEDMTINVLEGLYVKDYFRPGRVTTLEEGTTLKALTDIIVGTNELYFPIKNTEGAITGMLGMKDVRKVLYETCLFDLIVVRDLAGKPATLVPKDDLYTALMKFVDTDYGQIPVVHPESPHTIIGILNREDVFNAYKNAITIATS